MSWRRDVDNDEYRRHARTDNNNKSSRRRRYARSANIMFSLIY